ncbi:MAG: hypothetical protein DRR19_04090 [Candidatus Parabeggiatoa sp. nov. 1]|nr:MAG: hypothetical protein DRR19_04090 [Gammaproteobacteria bacterium]
MNHFVQAIKSVPIWLTVFALHALLLWQLLQVAPAKTSQTPPKPIMVSLITPPPVVTPPLPSPKRVAQKPLSKKTVAKKVKKRTKPRKVKKAKKVKKVKKRQKPVVRKKFRAKTQKPKTLPPLLKEEEILPLLPLREEIPIFNPPLLKEETLPPIIEPETPPFRKVAQEDIWTKQTKTAYPNQQDTTSRQWNQSHHGVNNVGVTIPPSYQAAYLHNPRPSYPRLSKRSGEEGTVLLQVKVSQNGRVALVQIKKSSGFNRLDKAALKVVNNWRFVPAQKAGKVVSGWVIVPIVFQLR